MAAEPIIQLSQRYRSEFESSFDNVRQRSVQLVDDAKQKAEEVQSTAIQKKEEVVPALTDMSPVEGLQGERVLETYTWAAILAFTHALCSAICGILLAPIISLSGLGTSSALLIAYAVLPYIAYRHIMAPADDESGRFKLLAFAACEGLLSGYVLSDRALSTGGPLMFVTPLCIGIVTQLSKGMLISRQQLLGATIGSGLALHIILGLVGGQLSFAYCVLAALYSACGFASIQLYIKYTSIDQTSPTHIHQLGIFVACIACQAIVYCCMGASYDSYKHHDEGILAKIPNPLDVIKSK